MDAKDLAIKFHTLYEKYALNFRYETREDTKLFDENSNNGKLMIKVCEDILKDIKMDKLELYEKLVRYEEMLAEIPLRGIGNADRLKGSIKETIDYIRRIINESV